MQPGLAYANKVSVAQQFRTVTPIKQYSDVLELSKESSVMALIL